MNTKVRERNERATKPDFVTPTAIIELKRGLSALRELRNSLIELAVSLVHHSEKRGYLLMVDPRLSRDRLASEMKEIKLTLLPEVSKRLSLVIAKSGEIQWHSDEVPLEDVKILQRFVDESVESGVLLPSPEKQDEVIFVLLWHWINRNRERDPLTSQWLQETVGCNYRTVTAAIDRLGPAIKQFSNRKVALKYFPEQQWKRILAVENKVRATIRYADTSDQPRSPESLLKRLRQFHRDDIAVGGVFGAKHYYSNLDIVGAPRLDLCLHVPGGRVDLEFVNQLDPALEQTRDPNRFASLALHFLRRKKPLFDRDNDGFFWADQVECLMELYDARLEQQALEFQNYLTILGRERNTES